MKRSNVIAMLWVLWICLIIGMVFGVYFYIKNKRVRLRSEIRENIENLFEGQSVGTYNRSESGFYDVDYSDKPIRHYKKVAIPSKPAANNEFTAFLKHEQTIDEWKQSYGDLVAMYELNWGDKYPNQEDDGWSIIRIYCGGNDDDFIQTNIIFPYKVGLKKTEWGNFYTVEQAVNEAFEFYSTNPKSYMADRFSKGSSHLLWSRIYDSCNEYFGIVENQNTGSWIPGIPIYQPKGKSYEEAQRTMPYENGWMHNGYYRVFIAATQERHYMIQEKDWAVNENRNRLLIWWGISLTVLFLSIIIPLTIKESKVNKRKSETLYQCLCRLCNPSIFMKNYDKEKVDKANEIYQKLMEIKPEDKAALMSLQAEAVANLGVVLIDTEKLKDLTEKVNPQRFMNPYDAEKVKLANDLYSRLTKEGLTYEEFEEIEESSKSL